MTTTSYVDRTLFHTSGRKIGSITDVIHRPDDLTPEWVTVRMGLLRRQHLVPIAAIDTVAGRLVTPLDPRLVSAAPVSREHYRPTGADRDRLVQHYGSVAADGSQPAADFARAETGHPAGFLVVLDEAVGSRLIQTLDEGTTNGATQVHVIVPVMPASPELEAYTRLESDIEVVDAGATLAQWQLATALQQLKEHGFAADGVVAEADPVAQVVEFVKTGPHVDGVIVSTRSETRSRWLGRDLPSRITRVCPVPVVAVIVDDQPLAA